MCPCRRWASRRQQNLLARRLQSGASSGSGVYSSIITEKQHDSRRKSARERLFDPPPEWTAAILPDPSRHAPKGVVSRADLTVDVLLPASLWNMNLIGHLVKRADSMSPYFHNDHLTGIQIGKGKIMARFYDKPLEIRTKSQKDWMYDVWGIVSVAEDHKIIRVEFQLRREVLKELGIVGFDDLTQKMPSLWAYCTREWLKVQDDPKLHHTQQTTLPWWVAVQGGMAGAQDACPAVRVKAIALDKQRNIQQMVGHAIAIMALERQGEMLAPNETLDSASHVASVIALTLRKRMDDRELTRRVKHRQAKFMRAGVDFSKVGGSNIGIGVSSKRTRHTGNPS